jgi:hypothetical protein
MIDMIRKANIVGKDSRAKNQEIRLKKTNQNKRAKT